MPLQAFKTMTYSLMHLSVAMTVAFLLTRSWHAALAIGLIEPPGADSRLHAARAGLGPRGGDPSRSRALTLKAASSRIARNGGACNALDRPQDLPP